MQSRAPPRSPGSCPHPGTAGSGRAGAAPAPKPHVALRRVPRPAATSASCTSAMGRCWSEHRASLSKCWGGAGSVQKCCQIPPSVWIQRPGSHGASRERGQPRRAPMESWSIPGCCCIYSLVVPGQQPGGCSEGDAMGSDWGRPWGLTAPHAEDAAMNSVSLHPNHPGFSVMWRQGCEDRAVSSDCTSW